MGITVTRPRVSGAFPPHDTPGRKNRAPVASQGKAHIPDQDPGPDPFGDAGPYPPPPQNAPTELDPDLYGPDEPDPGLCGPADFGRELAELERQVFTRPAHHADMKMSEIMRVIGAGVRRTRDQLEAIDAAASCPDLAGVRGDFAEHLIGWYRVHVLHASWGGTDGGLARAPRGVTSPGRRRVCQLLRISVTTYKRCRRWWEQRGYIAVVRPGWTPDLSPGILRLPGREHNTTQAYVLTVPVRVPRKARRPGNANPTDLTGPLSLFSNRQHPKKAAGKKSTRETGASCCYQGSLQQLDPSKASTRDRSLQRGVLARVCDACWHRLTRRFADLPPATMLYVIDHYPGGQPHAGTDDRVRNPAAWLHWRLSHWTGPDGTRKPTPREQAADRARLHRQQQAERRAQADRTAAAAASAEAQRSAAASAAALLAASSAEAAKVMARAAVQRAAADVPEPRPADASAPAKAAGTAAAVASAGRPSLASLARELYNLKQAGQLDDQSRAAAVGAWETRRAAPAEPPAIAGAPLRGGTGGYRPTPEYAAAVAAAVANVAAWEAAQSTGAEGPDDQGGLR